MRYTEILNLIQSETEKTFMDLDLVSENITNLSTPGYKEKESVSFNEVFQNMKAGQLLKTNNDRDISIDGIGFFTLEDENGKLFYTRNLQIKTDADLYLKSGDKFLHPKIKLNELYSGFEVKKDGQLYVKDFSQNKVKVGELSLVNFPAAEKLKSDGQFFQATEESGTPRQIQVGDIFKSQIYQNVQESSNVNSGLEFSRFSRTNSQLKTLASMMQAINTNYKQYINTLNGMASS